MATSASATSNSARQHGLPFVVKDKLAAWYVEEIAVECVIRFIFFRRRRRDVPCGSTPCKAPARGWHGHSPGRRDRQSEHDHLHDRATALSRSTREPHTPTSIVLTEAGSISKREYASRGRPR